VHAQDNVKRARQGSGGPASCVLRLCYELQMANAVIDTAPLPLTTIVAVACQAFVPDGADVKRAARLCPPLVIVPPPPSRILPAAHVAVLVDDTVPAAAVVAIVPGVPEATTVEPAIVPAGP
jgi:hypothetical protein